MTTQPELLPCPKDVETLRNANNAVALLQEIIEGLRSHPNPPTHRGVPLDGSLWFVKMCVTDLQMLQSRTPSPATHTEEEVEHSREQFESLHWEERCCFSTPDTITRSDYFMRGKLPSGWRYIDMYVELCWRSWCAALSMQPNTAEAQGDKCLACGGNDADAPCAYPRANEAQEGCLRNKRLATLHQPTEDEAVEIMANAIMDYEQNILIEGHPTQRFDKETDTGFMAYARVAYRALNRPVGGENGNV